MKRRNSAKDTFLYGGLAILMIACISVDLILFGNGIILSMVTATIPFIGFASVLMYSLMRLNIMEFTSGSYYDIVNREMNEKLAEKEEQKALRRSYTGHSKHNGVGNRRYSPRGCAC